MKKKLLTLLFGMATVALAMAATNSTLPADTNGDGTVTTDDAALIYAYILGTADEAVTLAQVDVNGDGTINTLDVVEVYVEMNKGFSGSAPDSDDSEF
jgi:hypothetical protein